jgi:hypothetical protein
MLSADAQNVSKRGHARPLGSSCVQPSDSPGVFSQKYASINDGYAVAAVGGTPMPAPRMLHQFAHWLLMFSTPLRPVSMTKCGTKAGATARIA